MKKRQVRQRGVVGQEFKGRWSDMRCKIVRVETGAKKSSVVYVFKLSDRDDLYSATKSAFEYSWVPLDYEIKTNKAK